MSDPNAQPIAGWYPDPENEAGDRWWNGATWSDHRRARNAGPGWAPAEAASAGAAAAGATAAPVAGAAPGIPVPPLAPAAGAARPNPYGGTSATAAAYPGATYPAAAPGAQPYAPPYAYNYAPRTPMQNVPAFAGMITSLCAILFNFILFGLPGIIGGSISIYGLVKANRLAASGVTVGNGRGFAITGIISGFLGAFLWDLFYFTTISPLAF
jgi:hypothetical protein